MEMHKVPQLCWGQTCIVFAFAACGSKIVSCKTEWHKIETSHLYNRVKFLCACGCAGPVLQCENSMGPYRRKPLEFKIMRSSPLFAIVFLLAQITTNNEPLQSVALLLLMFFFHPPLPQVCLHQNFWELETCSFSFQKPHFY